MSDLPEPEHTPEWNEHGHDMAVATRYVYVFVNGDLTRVKMGSVGRHRRLAPRRDEVAKAIGGDKLKHMAHVAIPDINGHELEGFEASMQTWLAFVAGLPFAGAVDWLEIPDGSPVLEYDADQWQALLDRALGAVLAWRAEL